jgi:hypothetical protein
MPEPIISSVLISAAKELLPKAFELITGKKAVKLATSAAFRKAFTETEIYCSTLERTQARNIELEHGLARLWSEAAAIAAPYNKEISDFCLNISRYWINPPEDPQLAATRLLALISSVFGGAVARHKIYK